ncbi:MAG: hypothetical protein CL912_01560 [Deltaproteobacteria bacterium]|nr:hypothetical protein [Deltaproteobacteria bacterium]
MIDLTPQEAVTAVVVACLFLVSLSELQIVVDHSRLEIGLLSILSQMPARKSRTRQARTQRAAVAPPPPPRPRTHAFTGCLTCRERHVKCDLGEPHCQNCIRLKVPCEGYSRKYTWVSPKILEKGRRVSDPESPEEVEESQSSRRVLFSGLPPFSSQCLG